MPCIKKCCETSNEFVNEYWTSEARSTAEKKAKLDELLMLLWEKQEEGVDLKLPFPTMTQPIPNGVKKEAGISRTMHTLHLTTRNSATNKVEEGSAIVAPTAKLADIVKFTSVLQSVSVCGGVQFNEGLTWTSMGFKPQADNTLSKFASIPFGASVSMGSPFNSVGGVFNPLKEVKF